MSVWCACIWAHTRWTHLTHILDGLLLLSLVRTCLSEGGVFARQLKNETWESLDLPKRSPQIRLRAGPTGTSCGLLCAGVELSTMSAILQGQAVITFNIVNAATGRAHFQDSGGQGLIKYFLGVTAE